MKERLLTLLGAVLAFYILVQLFFPKQLLRQDTLSFPTSADTGKYGLAGAYQWLNQAAIPTHTLRERYDTLVNNPSLAERGNLLIVSLPLRIEAQANELDQLQTWVSSGNHLLLLTAMSDWPQWASRSQGHTLMEMLARFDIEIREHSEADPIQDTPINDEDTSQASTSETEQDIKAQEHPLQLQPSLDHPLTERIRSVEATWLDSEGNHWLVQGTSDLRSTLVLLRDQAQQAPALWLGFYGEGQVLISRHADLFGNASLALADNARLLDNIVSNLLRNDGRVIFDDMHQGLSAIYDPDAFFRDPRLHHTLFFLLALWVVYVMGHTNRFVQVRDRIQHLQLRDHVKAIGDLFARRLHSSATALRYAYHFFNEVRSYYGLPQNGQPVWDLLASNAAIDPAVLRHAEHLYQQATRQKQINLTRFVNTIKSIRRELQ